MFYLRVLVLLVILGGAGVSAVDDKQARRELSSILFALGLCAVSTCSCAAFLSHNNVNALRAAQRRCPKGPPAGIPFAYAPDEVVRNGGWPVPRKSKPWVKDWVDKRIRGDTDLGVVEFLPDQPRTCLGATAEGLGSVHSARDCLVGDGKCKAYPRQPTDACLEAFLGYVARHADAGAAAPHARRRAAAPAAAGAGAEAAAGAAPEAEPEPLVPLVRAEAGAGAGAAGAEDKPRILHDARRFAAAAAAAAAASAPVAAAGAGADATRPRGDSVSSRGKRSREPSVERSGTASPASSGGELAETFAAEANVGDEAEGRPTRRRRSHDNGGAAAAAPSFELEPIPSEQRKDFDTALQHMGITESSAVSLDVSALYRSASVARFGDESHWKKIQTLVKDHLAEKWDMYEYVLGEDGANVRANDNILIEDTVTGAPFPDKTAYLNALPRYKPDNTIIIAVQRVLNLDLDLYAYKYDEPDEAPVHTYFLHHFNNTIDDHPTYVIKTDDVLRNSELPQLQWRLLRAYTDAFGTWEEPPPSPPPGPGLGKSLSKADSREILAGLQKPPVIYSSRAGRAAARDKTRAELPLLSAATPAASPPLPSILDLDGTPADCITLPQLFGDVPYEGSLSPMS